MDSNQLAPRPISTKKDGSSFGGKIAAAPRERSSLANASFRVYYSLRAGAVPFLWESTPGTPKNGPGAGATAAVSPAETVLVGTTTTAELLPPISPPPSYQSPQLKATRCRARSTSWPAATAGGLLRALRGVLSLRKSRRQSPGRPTS